MTIRRTAGVAPPTPIPITNRAISNTVTVSPIAMPSRPTRLSSMPDDHQRPCVPAVGDRCEEDLRHERRQEADADDHAEPLGPDAVLVAEVVEHREHHAVARGQHRGHQTERQDPDPRHPGEASGGVPPATRRVCGSPSYVTSSSVNAGSKATRSSRSATRSPPRRRRRDRSSAARRRGLVTPSGGAPSGGERGETVLQHTPPTAPSPLPAARAATGHHRPARPGPITTPTQRHRVGADRASERPPSSSAPIVDVAASPDSGTNAVGSNGCQPVSGNHTSTQAWASLARTSYTPAMRSRVPAA